LYMLEREYRQFIVETLQGIGNLVLLKQILLSTTGDTYLYVDRPVVGGY